jgi:UDP-N-acetylenolpyruvoylglucosamine reductase
MEEFLRNNQNVQAQRSLKLSILNYVNANANQKNAARNRLISNINRVIESSRERRLPVSLSGNGNNTSRGNGKKSSAANSGNGNAQRKENLKAQPPLINPQ